MACAEMKQAIDQLSARMDATGDDRDPIDGRQTLCALIERATAELRLRIEHFRAPAEVEKKRKALEEASDSTDEMKRLDRYIKQLRRSIAQSGNLDRKLSSRGSVVRRKLEGAGPAEKRSPDWEGEVR
jgi:hypothetical protein